MPCRDIGGSRGIALLYPLGSPKCQDGHYGDEKNLLPLPGFEPWIVQPVVDSLHQLHDPGSFTVFVECQNNQILTEEHSLCFISCACSW